MRALNLRSFRLFGQKVVHLGNRAIESHNRVPMVVHVQDEVLPHHSQPDQGQIALKIHNRH